MFFNGHFPNNPIMPGVLQIEALAQTAAPILLTMEQYKGRLALFAGVDHVRFKNIVRPGDRFDMEVEMIKVKGPIAKCMGKGYVDGKLCVEAEITIALKQEEENYEGSFEWKNIDFALDFNNKQIAGLSNLAQFIKEILDIEGIVKFY